MQQVTLDQSIGLEGINVFNGRNNIVRFHAAPQNTGRVFVVHGNMIPADLEHAIHYRWLGASTVALEGTRHRAVIVEHTLSALYALGISNVYIELSDGVCPRFPRSVSKIVDGLAGHRVSQDELQHEVTLNPGATNGQRTIEDAERGDRIELWPIAGSQIWYDAYYPHKAIGEQQLEVELTETAYKRHVMNARAPFFVPFGMRWLLDTTSHIHGIRDDNALLIGRRSDVYPLNKGNGRYPHEFVRHKVLDFIGELALTNQNYVNVLFRCQRTGHGFDLDAMREFITRGVFVPYAEKKEHVA